jgi:hypothetical protein
LNDVRVGSEIQAGAVGHLAPNTSEKGSLIGRWIKLQYIWRECQPNKLPGLYVIKGAREERNNAMALRSISEIIGDLSKPIPRRLLKSKTVGGQKIQFLPWHTAVKFLDLYAPGWSYEIRHLTGIGGKLVLVSRISIPCAEGIIYREATGQEDEEVRQWGDSSSNAEAQALKRAAAKFGLCLYLYNDKQE